MSKALTLVDYPGYEVYGLSDSFFKQYYHQTKADFFIREAFSGTVGKILDVKTGQDLVNIVDIEKLSRDLDYYNVISSEETVFIQERLYTPKDGDSVYIMSGCNIPRSIVTNFKSASKEKADFFVIPRFFSLVKSDLYYIFVHEGAKKIFMLGCPREVDKSVIGKTIGECLNYWNKREKKYTKEEIDILCNEVGLRDAVCKEIQKIVSYQKKHEYLLDLAAGKFNKIMYEDDFLKYLDLQPITSDRYNSLKMMFMSGEYTSTSMALQILSRLDYVKYPSMAKSLLNSSKLDLSDKVIDKDRGIDYMLSYFKSIRTPYSKITTQEFDSICPIIEEDIRERLNKKIAEIKMHIDANIEVDFNIRITPKS